MNNNILTLNPLSVRAPGDVWREGDWNLSSTSSLYRRRIRRHIGEGIGAYFGKGLGGI